MLYCSVCQNMYYLKVNTTTAPEEGAVPQDELVNYCRNCGHEETHRSFENVCVLNTQISRNEAQFSHLVNEFTKYDPTLPRLNFLQCPNEACISNKPSLAPQQQQQAATSAIATATAAVNSEVVFIRYDDVNLKYVYVCVHCDTLWKNDI
jgi:hypothetical protein